MKFISILSVVILLFFSSVRSQQKFSLTSYNTIDEANQIKFARNIVANLAKEDYAAVQRDFHVQLKSALNTEKISESWGQYIETMGAFERILSATKVLYQGISVVRCRCEFAEGNGYVEVSFDEDDKVIGLYLK